MSRGVTRELSMAIALVVIWAFFAWQAPAFLSARNLSLLSVELAVTAVLALGMLVVLLPGQIDLSAGSGVGLAGAVAAVLVFWHGVPAPAALLLATLGAVLVWSAMGALIAIERIPAFIMTLGGLLIFRGLHWLVIENQTVPVVEGGSENVYSLLTTYFLPPAAGYLLAALVVAAIAASTLGSLRRGPFIDRDGEVARTKATVDDLRIRVQTLEQPVGTLSGGNQQKVVLGKMLLTVPRVLLLDEPTRGIDVGARLEVYELINRLTAAGKAIVLVSSELGELMGMSDRIVMLREGRIGGVFERGAARSSASRG